MMLQKHRLRFLNLLVCLLAINDAVLGLPAVHGDLDRFVEHSVLKIEDRLEDDAGANQIGDFNTESSTGNGAAVLWHREFGIPPTRASAVWCPLPNGKVFLFGGMTNEQTSTQMLYLSDTWMLLPQKDGKQKWAWVNYKKNTPQSLAGAGAASLDPESELLMLYGGQNSATQFTSTFILFNVSSLEYMPPIAKPSGLPEKRAFGCTATLGDGRAMVFGGIGGAGSWMADTHVYSLEGNQFVELFDETHPPALAYPACAYEPATEAIFMFGGQLSTELSTDEVWKFDRQLNWEKQTTSGAITGGRYAAGLARWRPGSLVLFGGAGQQSSTVLELDVGSMVWTEVSPDPIPQYPLPRHNAGFVSVVPFNDSQALPRVLLAWGKTQGTNMEASLFELTPSSQLPLQQTQWQPFVSGQVSSPPGRIWGAAAGLLPGAVVLFGGEGAGVTINQTWVGDFLKENLWDAMQSPNGLSPLPRTSAMMTPLLPSIAIMHGGMDVSSNLPMTDSWIFTYDRGTDLSIPGTARWDRLVPLTGSGAPPDMLPTCSFQLCEGVSVFIGGSVSGSEGTVTFVFVSAGRSNASAGVWIELGSPLHAPPIPAAFAACGATNFRRSNNGQGVVTAIVSGGMQALLPYAKVIDDTYRLTFLIPGGFLGSQQETDESIIAVLQAAQRGTAAELFALVWEQVSPGPTARYGAASASTGGLGAAGEYSKAMKPGESVDSVLVISGGIQQDSGLLDDCWLYSHSDGSFRKAKLVTPSNPLTVNAQQTQLNNVKRTAPWRPLGMARQRRMDVSNPAAAFTRPKNAPIKQRNFTTTGSSTFFPTINGDDDFGGGVGGDGQLLPRLGMLAGASLGANRTLAFGGVDENDERTSEAWLCLVLESNWITVNRSIPDDTPTPKTKGLGTAVYIAIGCACLTVVVAAAVIVYKNVVADKVSRERFSTLSQKLLSDWTSLPGSASKNFVVRSSDFIPIGQLSVGRKVGSGAVGTVFEGRLHGSPVAVKRLNIIVDDEQASSFVEEAGILSTMRHPNIVLFMGVSYKESTDELLIITEFCSRGNLFQYFELVRQGNEPSPSHVNQLKMILEMSRGIAYLHSRRIMHRDVKSANLLLTTDLSIKVGDFGLSKLLPEATNVTSVVGTPLWQAPEVMQREEAYDFSADIYSLGIVFWEVLSSQIPYHDRRPGLALLRDISENGLRPCIDETIVCTWPAGMEEIVKKCWATDPSKRPSIHEVVSRVEDLLTGLQADLSMTLSMSTLNCSSSEIE